MIRFRLDPSSTSVVGVCGEPGCSYRVLASSADEARQLRGRHEEQCHMIRGRQLKTRRPRTAIRTS
jgi:hypothetical protein